MMYTCIFIIFYDISVLMPVLAWICFESVTRTSEKELQLFGFFILYIHVDSFKYDCIFVHSIAFHLQYIYFLYSIHVQCSNTNKPRNKESLWKEHVWKHMFVRKVVGFFLIFQVDPSLFLRTVQNKKKQVTAVYLFGRRDISEDKFEEAASMVSKIIVIKHTVL